MTEKYVDESWKDSVSKQREKLKSGQEPENKIFVSDSWKDSAVENDADPKSDTAQPESATLPEEKSEDLSGEEGILEVNFINYVTSLAYQVIIFLGEAPNPFTGQVEQNLQQAKFLIDTLTMMREKTKGNLSKDEENVLNMTLYELQMKFVEQAKKEKSQ